MFRMKNLIILFISSLFITVACFDSTFLFQENFKVGSVSDKTVYANKTMTFVDQDATNQLINEAVANVSNVYEPDNKVYDSVASDLNNFVQSLEDVKNNSVLNSTNPGFNDNQFFLANKGSIQNPFGFTASELKVFYEMDPSDMQKMGDILNDSLKRIFQKGIIDGQVNEARTEFSDDPSFYLIAKNVRNLIIPKLEERIVPNMVYDKTKTDKAKQEAAKNVEKVYKSIQNGEIILRQGDVITKDDLLKLKELGLTQTQKNPVLVLKQFPYALMLLFLFHVYCFKFYPEQFQEYRIYGFALSLITLSLFISTFLSTSMLAYVPFLFALMIVVSFWGRKFVVFSSIVIGLLMSVKTGNDYFSIVNSVISGSLLAIFFDRQGTRNQIIISGFLVGFSLAVLNGIASYSFNLSNGWNSSLSFLYSSVAAGVLTIGLLPVFERLTGMVTPATLYELSDPSRHPLLKRLRHEAEGTYSHSERVSTLADLAAEATNADSLLLRAGALFHDVGKLKNPEYFIENSSPNTNPHLKMNPLESAKVILEHPHESIRLCRQFHVPEPIIRLISCHHSDSVLDHFFNQAKKTNPDLDVSIFRYTTPPPKTKEEGILLLADSTEAFSRVLLEKEIEKEELEQLIRKMIYSKIEKGDLRDCQLSIQEINTIIDVFIKHLIKSNHKRIQYCNDKQET